MEMNIDLYNKFVILICAFLNVLSIANDDIVLRILCSASSVLAVVGIILKIRKVESECQFLWLNMQKNTDAIPQRFGKDACAVVLKPHERLEEIGS